MKFTAIVAVSLLCLSGGAAFAGDGDGPFGTPDTAASLPNGFMNGEVQYMDQMRSYRAAGEVAPVAGPNAFPADGVPAASTMSPPTATP